MTLLLRLCCFLVGLQYRWGRRPTIDTNAWQRAVKPQPVPDFIEDKHIDQNESEEYIFVNSNYKYIIQYYHKCFNLPAADKVDSLPPE